MTPALPARRGRSAATSTTSSRCPEGRIGLVVGDVTDKGVPAAMVMATTHSILRTDAPAPGRSRRRAEPGQRAPVRRDAAEHVRHLPLRGARSGDRPPPVRQRRPQPPVHPHAPTASSSRAPPACRSACMPGLAYEEQEVTIAPGERGAALQRRRRRGARSRAASSTGSRASARSMARTAPDGDVIGAVLDDLEQFTGPAWEQEDDITLVSIARGRGAGDRRRRGRRTAGRLRGARATSATSGMAAERVVDAVAPLGAAGCRRRPSADGRGRGDHERDRARQRCRSEVPVRAAGGGVGRRAHRAGRRPGRRRRAARRPRRPTSRRSSPASRRRAGGAST